MTAMYNPGTPVPLHVMFVSIHLMLDIGPSTLDALVSLLLHSPKKYIIA